MSLIAIYGAFTLFPGSLTNFKRNRVMELKAEGFALSNWLDSYVPKNSKLLVETRSNAFIPRKFVSWEMGLRYNEKTSKEVMSQIIRDEITAIALKLPLKDNWMWLMDCYDDKEDLTETFYFRARNPFNKGSYYDMQLFIILSKMPNCLLD